MTSHELARKLLAGPDLMVTVRGYEGGVDEVQFILKSEPINLNVNEEWYYGKHEYHRSYDETPAPDTLAIHLTA